MLFNSIKFFVFILALSYALSLQAAGEQNLLDGFSILKSPEARAVFTEMIDNPKRDYIKQFSIRYVSTSNTADDRKDLASWHKKLMRNLYPSLSERTDVNFNRLSSSFTGEKILSALAIFSDYDLRNARVVDEDVRTVIHSHFIATDNLLFKYTLSQAQFLREPLYKEDLEQGVIELLQALPNSSLDRAKIDNIFRLLTVTLVSLKSPFLHLLNDYYPEQVTALKKKIQKVKRMKAQDRRETKCSSTL